MFGEAADEGEVEAPVAAAATAAPSAAEASLPLLSQIDIPELLSHRFPEFALASDTSASGGGLTPS